MTIIAPPVPSLLFASRPLNREVGQFGDSRIDNGFSSDDMQRRTNGLQFWLSFLTDQRVNLPYDLNFGVSGNTTAQMLDRIGPVLASRAGAVIVLGSTNDRLNGLTATGPGGSIDNLTKIRDRLLGARKTVIFLAELPRGETSFTAAGLTAATTLKDHLLVRQWLMEQRAIPGVYVVDAWPLVADPLSTLGYFKSGMTDDGLHPKSTGAYYIAKALQPLIEALYPPAFILPTTNADQYDVDRNPRGCLNTNPMMDGTGGSMSNGATGTVATGWAVQGLAGVTVTAAKYTDANGDVWQEIKGQGTPTASGSIVLIQNLTLSKFAEGDLVENVGKLDISGPVTGVQNIAAQTKHSNGTIFNQPLDGAAASSTHFLPPVPMTGTYRVRPNAVPASLTSASMNVVINGISGVAMDVTLRLRAIAARKVLAL